MSDCYVSDQIAIEAGKDNGLSADELLEVLFDDGEVLIGNNHYELYELTDMIDISDLKEAFEMFIFNDIGVISKQRELYLEVIQRLAA